MMCDPLDGSANIDVNVPVGTIFRVYQKITRGSAARWRTCCSQAGASSGRIRHLRFEHDAGVHHGQGAH